MMNNGENNMISDMVVDFSEAISHGMIVSRFAVLVSKELGLSDEFCDKIAMAGFLHDIGKLRISEQLHLDRSKAMVVEKMKYVRMHATFSRDILAEQGFDGEICDIVYHHHENNDGSGYPCNISGDDIPLGARIIRVCDVYTALISKRSYREAFSRKVAVELMIEEAKHFDMKIFLAFLRVLHSEDNKSIEKLLEKSIEKDAADYFKKYIIGETNLTS